MKRLLLFGLSVGIVGMVLGWNFTPDVYGAEKFNFRKSYLYNFYSVFSISAGDTWFVGSHGMICVFHPRSRSFEVQESGTMGNLYDVSFVGPKRGWIVGQNGLILHTTDGGRTWKRQESHTQEHLFSITFLSPKKGVIVGAFGVFLETDDGGKTWTRVGGVKEVDRIYNQVYFLDDSNGWVVGEFGTILLTEKKRKTWEEQKSPLGEKTLFDVYFEDASNGWIVAMDGDMMKSGDGGAHWEVIPTPVNKTLLSVQVRGGSGWAVGLDGIYMVYEGTKWVNATDKIPTRAWLKQCLFSDRKHGWIVGSSGTILKSNNGGKSWFPASDIRSGR